MEDPEGKEERYRGRFLIGADGGTSVVRKAMGIDFPCFTWMERFIIVVTSLHRDFMPSSWDMYHPTFWDWATYIGTMGFFLVAFFLFVRGMPMIAVHEIRMLIPIGKNGKKEA